MLIDASQRLPALRASAPMMGRSSPSPDFLRPAQRIRQRGGRA